MILVWWKAKHTERRVPSGDWIGSPIYPDDRASELPPLSTLSCDPFSIFSASTDSAGRNLFICTCRRLTQLHALYQSLRIGTKALGHMETYGVKFQLGLWILATSITLERRLYAHIACIVISIRLGDAHPLSFCSGQTRCVSLPVNCIYLLHKLQTTEPQMTRRLCLVAIWSGKERHALVLLHFRRGEEDHAPTVLPTTPITNSGQNGEDKDDERAGAQGTAVISYILFLRSDYAQQAVITSPWEREGSRCRKRYCPSSAPCSFADQVWLS